MLVKAIVVTVDIAVGIAAGAFIYICFCSPYFSSSLLQNNRFPHHLDTDVSFLQVDTIMVSALTELAQSLLSLSQLSAAAAVAAVVVLCCYYYYSYDDLHSYSYYYQQYIISKSDYYHSYS